MEETPITVKLDYIQRDINEIKERLENEYVTHQEFEPIKNVVYGIVSMILIAVIGAVLALVIK